MKKLFTMLFVAGIATGALAYTDEKSVEIRQMEGTKVLVAVNESPNGSFVVRITDAENRLILRDKITKSEAFAKKYDLNALPVGDYSIEVSDKDGTLRTATFNTQVTVKPLVYSKVTAMGDNQYRLLVSNLKAKDVTVQIFDGNNLIHSELIENPQGLHKIYKIEQPANSEGISFKIITSSGFEAFVAAR